MLLTIANLHVRYLRQKKVRRAVGCGLSHQRKGGTRDSPLRSAHHSQTARNYFNKRGLLNQEKSTPRATGILPRKFRTFDLEELRQLCAVATEYTSGECGVIHVETSLMESLLVKAKRTLAQDTPSSFRRSRAVPITSPSHLRLIHASKENHHYI